MPTFQPPIRDMAFVLEELAGLDEIAALPGCGEASPDLVTAVLAEAARFGAQVLAPLNPVGDREGCVLEDGEVRTPPGFAVQPCAGWRSARIAAPSSRGRLWHTRMAWNLPRGWQYTPSIACSRC